MSASYFDDPRPDVQALVPPRARRVLDVGCGAGALGSALKAAGVGHVAGVEGNPDAAAVARARLDRVVEGDLTAVPLPFEHAEFDCLVFADVLEHVSAPDRVLHRYLGFLAADGRVIVSVPNMRFWSVLARLAFDRWSYTDSGIRDRTHLRIFTRRSLLALLAEQGLEVERLSRNYRLFEDQSHIGRVGAALTHVVRQLVGPLVFRNLLAFQYIAVARRRSKEPR